MGQLLKVFLRHGICSLEAILTVLDKLRLNNLADEYAIPDAVNEAHDRLRRALQ